MPIVNTPTILKLVTKSIDIVILSGFGGNKRYALPIITIYDSIGIAITPFDLEGPLLMLFTNFFMYIRDNMD
jgi:hypothetical protein